MVRLSKLQHHVAVHYQVKKKDVCIQAQEESINNQTAEYNKNDENTTIKDLQRRATFRDV